MPVAANPLAVEILKAKTPVGSVLNSSEWGQVPLELRELAQFSSEVEKLRVLQRIQSRLEHAINMLRRPGEGKDGGEGAYQTREKFVAELRKLAQDEGLDPRNFPGEEERLGGLRDITSERRLGLIWDTQTEMAQEYARWKADQDPAVLDAYPAQEFVRIESRTVPRTDWGERWERAGGDVFEGRMIALKNSDVWRKLSRFGTPHPPFDFGSGMGLRDVGRPEAERLGVLKPGDDAPRPDDRAFNRDREASVADLSQTYRDLLAETFPQLEITGDKARWR